MAALNASDITIAVTVFDRRRYIAQAIESALNQDGEQEPTVLVVEDKGPDPELRGFVEGKFGSRITYIRNYERLGLCGNWNACIAACRTSWLCILHDDDFLEPTFVSSMIELAAAAPDRGLYYGLCHLVDQDGKRLDSDRPSQPFAWHERDLEDWTRHQLVCFPGQLFNVAAARSLGGFRASSQYAADWEMWFKLALHYGAAATNRIVANYREHQGPGRGTVTADARGRRYAYSNLQRKRHVAWLRHRRPELRFERGKLLAESPMSIRYLLQNAWRFSPRMLRYNVGLLRRSASPHWTYGVFQNLTRALPLPIWKGLSRLLRWVPTRFEADENKAGGSELQ